MLFAWMPIFINDPFPLKSQILYLSWFLWLDMLVVKEANSSLSPWHFLVIMTTWVISQQQIDNALTRSFEDFFYGTRIEVVSLIEQTATSSVAVTQQEFCLYFKVFPSCHTSLLFDSSTLEKTNIIAEDKIPLLFIDKKDDLKLNFQSCLQIRSSSNIEFLAIDCSYTWLVNVFEKSDQSKHRDLSSTWRIRMTIKVNCFIVTENMLKESEKSYTCL